MNDDTFKYYFYYIKYDNEEIELYAATDDKKLAKRFREERDMSLFIEKVHKCTRKEIKKITQDHPDIFLELMKGKTKKNDSGSETIDISFVVTIGEKMTIVSQFDELIYTNLMGYAAYDISIFNKDIRKALEYIDYDKWHRLYEADVESYDDASVGLENYELDLFGTFVYYYGKLIGGGKEE